MRRPLVTVLLALAVASPAAAQEATRPEVVDDQTWCQRMLPGREMRQARQRCVRFLGGLAHRSLLNAAGSHDEVEAGDGTFVIPSALVNVLVLNGGSSMGITDDVPWVDWSEPITPEPGPTPAPAPAARDDFARDACAGSAFERCEEAMGLVMDYWSGDLVAICEYGDGQGDVVLLESRGDAESVCSGDGLIEPSRVAAVLRIP